MKNRKPRITRSEFEERLKEDIAKIEPTKDGVALTPDEVIDLLADVTDHINCDVPTSTRQEPVPDESVGISERNSYGYTYSEMLLLQDK